VASWNPVKISPHPCFEAGPTVYYRNPILTAFDILGKTFSDLVFGQTKRHDAKLSSLLPKTTILQLSLAC